MCLRAQGIDNNNCSAGRVRRERGLSDDDGGVDRGQGIYNASKGLETTAEAAGDRRRTKESTTTTDALTEEDEPED